MHDAPKNQSSYIIGGEVLKISADWAAVKEELLAIYERSVPAPVMPKTMDAVISDELAECFNGTKSVVEAGRILQNRVQLYLDEGN